MSKNVVPKVPTEETDICYTVSIKRPDDLALGNLKRFIEAKGVLIKKAFNIDSLPIEESNDTITFDWLPPNATQVEIHALMSFIAKLCAMCEKLKRVTIKEKEINNQKYAFRCLLIRIGMIGDEYKRDRALLLSRLKGNSCYSMKGAEFKDE